MIEEILAKLEKVKRSGPNNWTACCPAHEDKNPSFALHQATDGRILGYCRAGCSIDEIVNAVGLGWDAWWPPKQEGDSRPAIRRPYPAADILALLVDESHIVAVAACNLGNGFELTHGDHERLLVAMTRIEEARRLALGGR